MEPKKPFELEDPHKKAQDAIDRATDARTSAGEQRRRKHAGEPYLIPDGPLQRCSVCGFPFGHDLQPSRQAAFLAHLLKAHQPGQTTEDFSQAAVRIVRETTEK